MAEVITLETNKRFHASKWIGVGKIYKNVPLEVADACTDARQIPTSLAATLPSPGLSVKDFIALKLPGIVRTKRTTQTEAWFSTDPPNCNPATTLWSRDCLPEKFFVRELEHDFPQKWLNGAKSLVDPLDKSLRLPLSSLTFYQKMHGLRDAQEKWTNSFEWARTSGCSLDILASVAWNTFHRGAPDGQLDWTRLVDDEWLSGGIVDTMMADIQARVAEVPALDAAVAVASLAFQRAIVAVSTQKTPSDQSVRLLKGYKELIAAGKSVLYFPLHVHGNHWIAFFINFLLNVFGYGKIPLVRDFKAHRSQEIPWNGPTLLKSSTIISKNGCGTNFPGERLKTSATCLPMPSKATTSTAVSTWEIRWNTPYSRHP